MFFGGYTDVKTAVERLDEGDQELTERIFDAILQIHHYRDQKQLIQYISRWLGGGISEDKITSIFARLSKNIGKENAIFGAENGRRI